MATEEGNTFDDDFETKMYHFLDPPHSPEIVPSPDMRRDVSSIEAASYNTNNSYSHANSASNFDFFNASSSTTPPPTTVVGNNGVAATPSKWFCVQCNRSFSAQFALDQHRRFKHQGYKIHCRHCSHTSTNGYALFLHVQREHSDVEGNGYSVNGMSRSNTKKAISARKKRRSVKQLAGIQTSTPSMDPNSTDFRPKLISTSSAAAPFDGGEIKKLENGGTSMVGLMRTATTPGNNGSNSKRKLKAMKIVRQAGIPPLDCDKCGKKFAFHSGLRMHTKMVHSGFRFTCQYCGLHFTNGYAIHRHVNIVHNVIGAVRNSCFSAGSPAEQNLDVKLSALRQETPLPDQEASMEAAANHIRLRLRRKALPTKMNSALEWSATAGGDQQQKLTSQRYVAPAPFEEEMSSASTSPRGDPSSSTAATATVVSFPSATIINCPLCPFKTERLELLTLHGFKHRTPEEPEEGQQQVQHPFRCPYCTYMADRRADFHVHAASHFQTSSGGGGGCSSTSSKKCTLNVCLRCTFCERRFDDEDLFVEHEKQHVKTIRFF